ncbi:MULTISPECIES: 3-hydroxybutyryl-CoA dehydrogenase [unclassified Streptomyces]|uniref:3-hydroxybutyryl-CoA dehydrogenase n=1 Tax=unclassified Streptomyces TaxID=2593676 RepID=UPI002DDC8DF7|nr:3-hydroxybutyryl-CoA dehydrogenase [Streptomyces sp. NBC_01294]WRZ56494.1 3-hydroxybutyryl-CoA dehydrogenase [Streptomyces sp. NBC_01294]
MVETVGIVGCGIMGAGIAELTARSGLDVRVAVGSEESRLRGLNRIVASLDRGVARGRITDADRSAALGRISFTTDMGQLADRQLVIESVREDEETKLEVFRTLDKVLEDDGAIIATNTSSLSVARLAAATNRPRHVVGIHFFNPVPVLPLVELVPSVLTAPETVARANALLTDTLGRTVIQAPDRAGFLINALLFPYLLSAIRMVDSGLATAEVIDRGMESGCSHPMGPLRLADLIGLDTTVSIAQALYEETKQPLHAPPPLLLRMVESGLLGRKSGRGFYTY